MIGLAGRTALVTGAGSAHGIGFATARILAAAGAHVAITSTTARVFDRLASLPEQSHAAFVADLTDPDAAPDLVREAEAAIGPIDILVNNAGMAQTGRTEREMPVAELAEADWARALDLNLTTAFRLTRAVLPGMIARGHGRIVFIASVTGPLVSNPASAGYSAAKAGMTGLMRALALETARHGITVNAVGPGWIATESAPERERMAGTHTPIGRPGTADEVGHVAAFLASDAASYVTGQLVVVDGGNSIQEYKGPPDGWY
ncbi:MAG TPA: SDR family NAD(P)-dependent oxidoreductase [Stellaceae bacterium]|nr:SDR family NAD(P)-dependent oxidoreductase [Stellaceae bacterium]